MTSTIIIVPAEDQAPANQAALQFDPTGGSLTFTVPLSTTGELPATHYWCAGPLMPEQVSAFCEAVPSADVIDWDMDAAPDLPAAFLEQHELQRISGESEP